MKKRPGLQRRKSQEVRNETEVWNDVVPELQIVNANPNGNKAPTAVDTKTYPKTENNAKWRLVDDREVSTEMEESLPGAKSTF